MSRSPRSLAEELRAWPDDRLARLLLARPDLGTPVPRDSSQLAARVSVRSSVARAADGLGRLELAVLQALLAGRDPRGLPASEEGLRRALQRLGDLALVWGDPPRPVSSVAEVLQPGLDHHDDTDPDRPLDQAPPLATTQRETALVDRTAAGAAFELVRRTDLLLDRWGTAPPAVLRSGGLGVRDLRAAATLLHLEPLEAALVVETAHQAGLLGSASTEEHDEAWVPTEAYDDWQERPVAERWLVLARAWLDSGRLVAAVGRREQGKPVNALEPDLARTWVRGLRQSLLAELATTAPGESLTPGAGLETLAPRLAWRRPRRPPGHLRELGPLLAEAAQVGLLGRDAIASYARLLVTGDGAGITTALTPLLPQPVDHVLVQADLTAVAPGPLEQDVARRLAMLADVESRGGATVYRFDAGSVRRAFDAGWAIAEVHQFLEEVSRTPVPQALSYLVDDVSRRFGTVRAGQAESFLRSDDEAALAELVHDPGAASLRLRRIAPTVVVSDVPLHVLLPRVRDLGIAPVVEAADGTVVVARPDSYRVRRRRTSAPATVREPAHVARAVAAVRAGDRAAGSRADRPLTALTPVEVVALLRQSLDSEPEGRIVIGYVGDDGTVAERLVRPLRVEGGRLTAYDERSDLERSFALHRITAASREA